MSNITANKPVKADNKTNHKSVGISVRRTHCIVCKSAFKQPRAGKLYCSNNCKQFGYNHKEIKTIELTSNNERKNKLVKKLFLKDYASFIEMTAELKRYKELTKRQERFREQEHIMSIKAEMGIVVNQEYALSHYLLQLNNEEFHEHHSLEFNYQDFKNSDPPILSIEQWSFFKCLFKKLDDWDFIKIVSQFSKDYIQQLNLKPIIPGTTNELSIIKQRYINHCNEITTGAVKFF